MTFQRCNTRDIVCLTLGLGLVGWGTQRPVAQVTHDDVPGAVARRHEIACAPRLAVGEPSSPITLIGSDEGPTKTLFGPGDALVISGGTEQGVAVDQEYFVRRVFAARTVDPTNPHPPLASRTAGWIRVVAVQPTTAVAFVVHACAEFGLGDHIEPFELPQAPVLGPAGEADYSDPAMVLFGRDGAVIVSEMQFMVIDRGRNQGVTPGQRLTVFREAVGSAGPVIEVAEAAIVGVAPDSATARVMKIESTVYAGDLVALHH